MTLEQALMMEAYYRMRNVELLESEIAMWKLAQHVINQNAENSIFVPVKIPDKG